MGVYLFFCSNFENKKHSKQCFFMSLILKNFIMKKNLFLLIAFLLISLIYFNGYSQNCQWQNFSKDTYFQGKASGKMGINSKGWVVIATEGRIYHTKDTVWDGFSDFNLPYNYAVCIDEIGDIYAAHYSFGFYHYDIGASKKNIYNDTNSSLISNDINLIKQDPKGNFWLSNWSKGVSYWDGDTFINYNTSQGLCDNWIHDIEFRDGFVVFSSINGPLSIYNDTNFITIPKEASIGEVSDIALDAQGNIWALMYSMSNSAYLIGKYDGTKWITFPSPFQKSVYLTDIAFDKNNNMWISSWNGLVKFNGMNYRYYKQSDGLINDSINHFKISSKEEIWFSSEYGVSKLTESGQISGQVFAGGNPATAAFVKLFKLNKKKTKTLELIDSVGTNASGNFDFSDLKQGEYMLYAGGEVNYVNTYLGDVESWMKSKIIYVAFCDSLYDNNTINLIDFHPIAVGNGKIAGKLVSADGTRAGAGPIKDVDVTLKKVPGGVVKIAKTNQFGLFEFDEIDTGTFSLIIDIPGLSQDSVRQVVITDSATTFSHQDYEVDSTGIHLGDYSSVQETFNSWGKMTIYPNPATFEINTSLYIPVSQEFEIELVNSNGQLVYYKKTVSTGQNNIKINIQNQARGLYLLTIKSSSIKSMQKVVVM
jgi:hypothetical protein